MTRGGTGPGHQEARVVDEGQGGIMRQQGRQAYEEPPFAFNEVKIDSEQSVVQRFSY